MWIFVVVGGATIVMTVLLSIPVALALYTLLLAALTQWRDYTYQTAVYVGRVSHTRLIPVVHSFSYPLFMCAIDLEEVEELWGTTTTTTSSSSSSSSLRPRLWPLSTILQFRSTDHYKNGEGGTGSLADRTFSLLKERTNHEFSFHTHTIVLVTHLCYYGYCFNPVSFYYILKRHDDTTTTTTTVDAIVMEVSNTPWKEMHVYVLHPSSVDILQGATTQPSSSREGIHHVRFEKTFHVSPFMAMDYVYDWVFSEFSSDKDNPIHIYASMKKANTAAVEFTASVQLHRQPFSTIVWQVVKFPMYCVIIQVWIHMEAFWLFSKGVTYQPHPKGSETTASRMIATVMTPLFAVKHWLTHKKKE